MSTAATRRGRPDPLPRRGDGRDRRRGTPPPGLRRPARPASSGSSTSSSSSSPPSGLQGRARLRETLSLVDGSAYVDIAVPTASNKAVGSYVKRAIRKGLGWYMDFIVTQIVKFAWSVSRMFHVVVDHIEDLEATVEAHRSPDLPVAVVPAATTRRHLVGPGGRRGPGRRARPGRGGRLRGRLAGRGPRRRRRRRLRGGPVGPGPGAGARPGGRRAGRTGARPSRRGVRTRPSAASCSPARSSGSAPTSGSACSTWSRPGSWSTGSWCSTRPRPRRGRPPRHPWSGTWPRASPLHPETWAHLLGSRGFSVTATVAGRRRPAARPRGRPTPPTRPTRQRRHRRHQRAAARPDGVPRGRHAGAVTAVHQFVPALLPRDATGDHTRALRDAFRSAGWESDIYVEAAHDELQDEATYFEEYPARARPGDVLLYQLGTSSPVAEFLLGRDEPLVLDYHNVTPESFYEGWEEHTVAKVALARRAGGRAGARRPCSGSPTRPSTPGSSTSWAARRPPWCRSSSTSRRTAPAWTHASGPGWPPTTETATVLLFVGRISPNKCHRAARRGPVGLPPALRPRCPAPPRRPDGHPGLRRGRLRLRRRAGPGRRRPPRRGADRRRSWPPGTRTPTCSSACPSTRDSASRCSRRCGPGPRSWPSTPERWGRPWPTPASCSPTARPATGGRRRGPDPRGRRAGRVAGRCRPPAPGRLRGDRPRGQRFVDVLAGVADGRAGGGVKLAFVTPALRHRGHRRGRDGGPDARRATVPAARLGGGGPHQLRPRPPHLGEHGARRDDAWSTG